jgi:hypothetical protein
VDVIGSSPVGPTASPEKCAGVEKRRYCVIGILMIESELIGLWSKARWHIIVSQLAPTALLGFTVWLALEGLAAAPLSVRIAAVGILLASGILGAAAQFSSASEAQAVAGDLMTSGAASAVSRRIVASASWLWVVKFVTPAIFVVIFVCLAAHLFIAA